VDACGDFVFLGWMVTVANRRGPPAGVRRTAAAAWSSGGVARWGELGHAWGEAPPFLGTWPQASEARTPRQEAAAARSSSAACGRALMGLAGGPRPGRRGSGRAFGLGPVGKDIFFFLNFFNAKTIPKKSRNCLKARQILQKSQKFQENSQS
jgi:hypothetical protein